MMGSTHLIAGIVGGYAVGFDLKGIALCALASMIPDIDIKGSIASKRIPFVHNLFKHRGVLHHPLMAIFIGMSFHSWEVFIGYFIHLCLDALTPRGIPLWKRMRIRGPIRTGSTAEVFFLIAIIVLTIRQAFIN